MRSQLFSLIISTFSLCLVWDTVDSQSLVSKSPRGKVVVCYVGTWSVYRPGKGAFNIADINPKLCSHLVYAFVGINNNTHTLRSIDEYHDLEDNYGKGSFRKMTRLKDTYPHLKVTLAVGGWNEGSKNYSLMAASSGARKAFIQSVMNYMTKFDFDGLDLDWEFPASRGGAPEDKQNFLLLVKELKAALSQRNLILTAALSAAPTTIDNAYDVPEISKYLDYIHLMAYDYHGNWDRRIGANAPLNSSDNLNLEYSIKYLIKLGAPPAKIVAGLAAYGHTFIAEDVPDMDAVTKEENFQGPYTRQDGFMGYNEICWELFRNQSSWQVLWDEKSTTPLAINKNRVISYDNERSIAEKVHLALKYKIGGFLVWSIDTDDFRGDCDINRDPDSDEGVDPHAYPLLRAIHRSIEVYDDLPSPLDVPTNEEVTTEAVNTTSSASTSHALWGAIPMISVGMITGLHKLRD